MPEEGISFILLRCVKIKFLTYYLIHSGTWFLGGSIVRLSVRLSEGGNEEGVGVGGGLLLDGELSIR